MLAGENTDFVPDPLAQFLGRVLAWSADSYVNIHADGGKRTEYAMGGQAFRGWDEYVQLKRHVDWLNVNQSDVYFCLATMATYNEAQSKPNKRRAYRRKNPEHVKLLKAFVIDLDVKPKGYPDQHAALKAVLPFLDKLGLKAGEIVSSGNGIHVYIVLDQPVTLDVWQPLADKLVAALQAHGIKCDTGVTKNPVTLIRLPGTVNQDRKRKDAAIPKPCRVLT